MATFENSKFENTEERLDGNRYINCTFKRCHLIYGGTEVVTLEGCGFHECSWSFTDAAERTINFMVGLYHGTGKGGKELIEKTFENIRRGHLTPNIH